MKKLIEAHNKLNPTPSDWKREAGIWSWIVDLTMKLNIGDPLDRIRSLEALMLFAHLARDKDLLRKAMDLWRQLCKETKIETLQRILEVFERSLAKWSAEFNSTDAPKKREIDWILGPAAEDLKISI